MSLLFFCFAFLALQVLLIEGPQGSGRQTSSTTSGSDEQAGIYGTTFNDREIQYLTEDVEPIRFVPRALKNGRRLSADAKQVGNAQGRTFRKYSPEVFWALQDLEAFANLNVVTDANSNKVYHRPIYSGYNDKTFRDSPRLHQVTALFSTKYRPYSKMCCSVFVEILPTRRSGISKARCGHPVCYAATDVMTYWSRAGQRKCHPPPINDEFSCELSTRLCSKLVISKGSASDGRRRRRRNNFRS